ncbi:hypothetical protein Tco_1095734 [Tanacetum coccineum]
MIMYTAQKGSWGARQFIVWELQPHVMVAISQNGRFVHMRNDCWREDIRFSSLHSGIVGIIVSKDLASGIADIEKTFSLITKTKRRMGQSTRCTTGSSEENRALEESEYRVETKRVGEEEDLADETMSMG